MYSFEMMWKSTLEKIEKSQICNYDIDFNNFIFYKGNLKKNILIEEDNSSLYKNIDESFKIIEKFNKDKFEFLYLSYYGKPKDRYKFGEFLN